MATRLAALILGVLAAFPALAGRPTSDLLTDYDGPVIKAPLFTIDENGTTSWRDIKLPYDDGPLLPYSCFRQGRVQKVTCLILDLRSDKVGYVERYLREVDV